MEIRSQFRWLWILKIRDQQLFSHLAVILSHRIFKSDRIDIELTKGLSHLGVIVDAQDESGLDLVEYRRHFEIIFQLQIMIVKGRFVVWWVQVK